MNNEHVKKKKSWLKGIAMVLVFCTVLAGTFYGMTLLLPQNKEVALESVNESVNPSQLIDKLAQTIFKGNGRSTVATNIEKGEPAQDISEVVGNVMPAIVAIECTSIQNVQDFFGRNYSQEVTGSGSGIIIGQNKEEVLIATNNHVVENAKDVTIVFDNQAIASAKIKGLDPNSDLAVVSVNIKDLEQETIDYIKIASLGDSNELKPGQVAIAIGNALGYGQSVTVGHVSALNRDIGLADSSMSLVQTDAAINPGNSGGALINANGEVVGINSAKFASDEVEGMGYAIPISDAIPIISRLMNSNGNVENGKAYLGVMTLDLSKEDRKNYNLAGGIYVIDVVSGSPAELAGIKQGDIITSINGTKIGNRKDLSEALDSYKPSDTVKVNIVRQGTSSNGEMVFNVTLGRAQ